MSSVTTNFLKIFRHFFGDIKSAAAHKFVRGGENSDISLIMFMLRQQNAVSVEHGVS